MKLLLALLLLPRAAFCIELGAKAPDFSVESGSGEKMTLAGTKGRITVILYETKDAIEENRPLKTALNKAFAASERLRESAAVLPVINCSAAFWPVSRVWKANLRKNSEKENITIYGDWSGKMLADYGAKDKASNVIIIDRQGFVRYFLAGPAEAQDIEKIIRLLAMAEKEAR